MKITVAACLLVFLSTVVVRCPGAEPVTQGDLGRRVKYRILVDKVMQPTEGWVTKEWMVEAAAEAGFNVFSPRRGHDQLDEVRQVTAWCEKYGIFHMPWMRGSLTAPQTASANGKRFVCDTGLEQPLWSPNSDEFWDWTNKFILAYAKLSRDNGHLIGVFLDYENYAAGRKEAGNHYRLSYDDAILAAFANKQGIDLPDIEPAKRKTWLEDRGLHEPFRGFQIDHWRARCRSLRTQLDEINPKFQFCIYPAPGTPFMVEACYPAWATRQAPLILADASTYGRSGRFTPQQEALQINRDKLAERKKTPQEAGIEFLYAGGIDPAVRGADPEFSGKNAVAISEVTDGYWIFYEGTEFDDGHPDYWRWFTWANRHIAAGNFEAQHEPRETPEDWLGDVFSQFGQPVNLQLPKIPTGEIELPLVQLRRENLLLLACEKGEPAEITLVNMPVSKYVAPLIWEVRDNQLGRVAAGEIPHGKTEKITFTPPSDGVYSLAATSGSCAWGVRKTNVPVGLYAGERLQTIRGAQRLYFQVPQQDGAVTITLQGWGAETVRGNVFDARGDLIASGQTNPSVSQTKIELRNESGVAETWSIELTRADEGVLEDQSIRIQGRLIPVLSLVPEQVFGVPGR